ncbi:MAG: virulence protein RhuM/Fic/DOC family protein [Lutibacter sp.]
MSEIIIYKKDNQVEVEITYDNESLWLNLNQIAELFDRDKSVISRHIKNIFKEEELAYYATVAKNATVQEEGKRKVARTIEYYNLDIILAVGYRVSSAKGTQFRIWANQVLKNYLIKGFAVNEKRLQQTTQQLQELKKVVQLQEKVITEYHLETDEAQGLIKVIASYSTALGLLDDYDHQRLKLPNTNTVEVVKINYDEARNAINELGKQTKFEGLFGKEKDDSFKGSLENIYQTFDGVELYRTIEEKAAHLLYFVVKNHSFTDGNKRIAAFLFVWFLERNNMLYQSNGAKTIADSTLVALTLMIAQSNPNEKDMMIKVIVNLLVNP